MSIDFCASLVVPLKSQKNSWLEKSVLSAVTQSIPVEVIVVTHPCTPNDNFRILKQIEERYSNLNILCKNDATDNYAQAINRGISFSNTSRIGLLLTDDWLDPQAVELCVKHSDDIVSSGSIEYDDYEVIVAERFPDADRFKSLETLELKASYLEHFFLLQKSKILDVGGLDETIGNVGPDDYDLIWTMLENNASVAFVKETLYHYRDHHGERLTLRDKDAMIADLEKVLDKHHVVGEERKRIIRDHSRWFGRPGHVVTAEIRQESAELTSQ